MKFSLLLSLMLMGGTLLGAGTPRGKGIAELLRKSGVSKELVRKSLRETARKTLPAALIAGALLTTTPTMTADQDKETVKETVEEKGFVKEYGDGGVLFITPTMTADQYKETVKETVEEKGFVKEYGDGVLFMGRFRDDHDGVTILVRSRPPTRISERNDTVATVAGNEEKLTTVEQHWGEESNRLLDLHRRLNKIAEEVHLVKYKRFHWSKARKLESRISDIRKETDVFLDTLTNDRATAEEFWLFNEGNEVVRDENTDYEMIFNDLGNLDKLLSEDEKFRHFNNKWEDRIKKIASPPPSSYMLSVDRDLFVTGDNYREEMRAYVSGMLYERAQKVSYLVGTVRGLTPLGTLRQFFFGD